MLGKTHISFGLALGAGCASVFSIVAQNPIDVIDLLLFYVAVALGSLLPDIDEPNSVLGKKTLGISNLLKAIFGHRGFTHSLSFIVLIGALTLFLGFFLSEFSLSVKSIPFLNGILRGLPIDTQNIPINRENLEIFCVGLMLGCAFHCLGDMMTISGVPLLLPFRAKNYYSLPRILRFKTGGIWDYSIAIWSVGIFVFLNVKFLF